MSTNFTRAVLIFTLMAFSLGCILRAASGEEPGRQAAENHKAVFYTVKEGETLHSIADRHGVSLQSIVRVNRLSRTVIHPKQVLLIPGANPDFEVALSRGYTRDDVMMLARAIHAEARGESFTGQVAVGAVILNRQKSGDFPGSIREIIMQKHNGTYQFTPVQDGSINLEPDEIAICAAIQAISGHDPTNGALYFYNPEIATDQWIRTLQIQTRIGNHVFATKA
ncbi:MAG: cell wall hydrolase [Bacillota bacterium]